jgi:hypothetical protein
MFLGFSSVPQINALIAPEVGNDPFLPHASISVVYNMSTNEL